ncbi:hypothetical protein [Lactococcus garvieae]|uniref:Apea-like HEPN domain-containing protein n=1 Tax=Lactococcus garvieae TaxID=1363 RepID=A0AAX3NBD0_9LACT|nr:hypothetical protein [Lactococcus garvieae]WEA13301.1 hypothetical protein PWF74_07095 [Lactococcus garvieae]
MPQFTFNILVFPVKMRSGEKHKSIPETFKNTNISLSATNETAVYTSTTGGKINFTYSEIDDRESPSNHKVITFGSQDDIEEKNIEIYDEFIKDLKISLSKFQYQAIFLDKSLSKYYSEKLYPLLHDFEIELRKFIHAIFFKIFGANWEKQLLPQYLLDENNYKVGLDGSDHIIEELELSTIENLLFNPNFVERIDESGSSAIVPLQNIGSYNNPNYVVPINFLSSDENRYTFFSLWEKYFSSHVSEQFQGTDFFKNFGKLRNIRNQVAHNKKVTNSDLLFAKEFLTKFIAEINSISTALLFKATTTPEISPLFESVQRNEQMAKAIRATLAPSLDFIQHFKSASIPTEEILENLKEVTLPQQQMAENLKNISLPVSEILENMRQVTLPQQQIAENLKNISSPASEILENMKQVTLPQQQMAENLKNISSPASEILENMKQAAVSQQQIVKNLKSKPLSTEDLVNSYNLEKIEESNLSNEEESLNTNKNLKKDELSSDTSSNSEDEK